MLPVGLFDTFCIVLHHFLTVAMVKMEVGLRFPCGGCGFLTLLYDSSHSHSFPVLKCLFCG